MMVQFLKHDTVIRFLNSSVLFVPLHAYFLDVISVSLSVLFCISKCQLLLQ